MSLATRCTSCGTVFRVVQDQLRVSDGWVRCGRCDAVFNAAEGLFDLERDAPPPWSPTQPPAEPPVTSLAPVGHDDSVASQGWDDVHDPVPRPDGVDAFGVRHAALGVVEAEPPAPLTVPADLIAHPFGRPSDDAPAVPGSALRGLGPDAAAATAPEPDTHDTPSGFGWRPDTEPGARGRRAAVAWAGAAVVLLAVLAAQVTAQFSEIAAARWPVLQPALAGWCGVAGCSVAAPRRIDEIVVDSSALAPVIGTEALKLGISLRNRAHYPVALPSVDLSLTDSAGRLLARRTLHPADFRVAAASIAPGGEVPLQAVVTAGAVAVTGYTVEIFYP